MWLGRVSVVFPTEEISQLLHWAAYAADIGFWIIRTLIGLLKAQKLTFGVQCNRRRGFSVGIAAFSPKKSLTRVFGLSGISQKIRPDAPVKGAAQRIYGVYSKQRYSFLYFYAKLSYSSAAASV